MHENSVIGLANINTLSLDLNYLPDFYKSYNGNSMITLIKDTSNSLNFLKYSLKWKILYKAFSSGIIKIDYKDSNGIVISSIHCILYDTIPNYQLNFFSNRNNIPNGQTINHIDSDIFIFNPKIYSYFIPLKDIKYGYDVILDNKISSLNLSINKKSKLFYLIK